jgi:hypothetical protein
MPRRRLCDDALRDRTNYTVQARLLTLWESILPEISANEPIKFSGLTENRDGMAECANERTQNDGVRGQPTP